MKNILLIGAGRFGRHLAMQMMQLGHQIMAVDISEERINEVLPYVTTAQIGDSTNADFLRSLGIGNYDVCFVTISGSFQNSLETSCGTVPTRSSTRRSRSPSGPPSATPPTTSSTTSRSINSTPSSK